MPYILEVCVAGKITEITKYFSHRVHSKGEIRKKVEEVTSEAQRRINLRIAERDLRRLLNANFRDGDYLIRLDFSRNKPESSKEMQELMTKFLRKLRTRCRKLGLKLKYIYVKEIGPRGGRHVHMVMTKIDTDIIRELWTYGGIHIDPLNSDGQYEGIANYFIKYSAKTEETEGRLIGKRWNPSQNLEKPKITKRIISANTFRREARPKKGFLLDKDRTRSGINMMGYEYITCTYIKQESRDEKSKHIHIRDG